MFGSSGGIGGLSVSKSYLLVKCFSIAFLHRAPVSYPKRNQLPTHCVIHLLAHSNSVWMPVMAPLWQNITYTY